MSSISNNSVRLGVAGAGNMGSLHARAVLDGKVARCELVAVADPDPALRGTFSTVKTFDDGLAMIESGLCDAILVATPHFSHPVLGIPALERGLHLLVEKPIAVHKADAERLLAAHTRQEVVFAAMFNQRTDPHFIKLRGLVRSGELGRLRRVQWTITNWFRTEAYYRSGGWRATWAGEGGGVLLNQCPHNLDLWQWMFGMPARIRAFCAYGRYHDIEVEDDVTAFLEYADGMTGVWIASTGEAPGTNRLEVVGERGKAVYEDDALRFTRNEVSMTEFSRRTTSRFATPETWDVRIPCSGHGGQHIEILNNFVRAILDGEPLIAPAAEGIRSVELANAMLLSSARGETIDLPLQSSEYQSWLDAMIARSKALSRPGGAAAPRDDDFASSFASR